MLLQKSFLFSRQHAVISRELVVARQMGGLESQCKQVQARTNRNSVGFSGPRKT